MGILIDLDQTLIDSQVAEQFRRNRQWADVYKIIPQLYVYPGISELLKEIKAIGVPVCIVTSSPKTYCEKVIKHYNWKIDATVCYHDTSNHKPHPEPIQKGLLSLGIEASEAVAIGDAAKDIQAAKAAGVLSIGTLWGSLEKDLLKASKPDRVCETVKDLREILLMKYSF